MTDEQTPGTPGEQPQDPTQPGQPGTPGTPGQQPPADSPPPPPVNPYEQQPAEPDPAAPPPYGEPQQPAYGEPPQPQYGQPAYGQPQPAYGQPPMSAGYPTAPVEPKASRAMAIIALILALLICIPFLPALVAIVLAVVVLVSKRPGKGLAISAIVISLLASAAWIGLFAAIGSGEFDNVFDDLLPVEQLNTGECLDADNLTDDSEDFVENIEEVSCDGPHDAEVLATKELTQDDAEGYQPSSSSLCTDLITEGALADKVGPEIGYFGLTTDAAPDAGDKLVCIAYSLDGTKLEAPL